MDSRAYRNFLMEKLTRHFDFLDVEKFPLFRVDLFAEHKQSSEKFFFTRKINLYSIDNNEFVIMCEVTKPLSVADIQYYQEQCKIFISKQLKISDHHMSSVIALVIVSPSQLTPEVVTAVKKVKVHKDFMFTLKGWADLALVVVDLEAEEVYHNTFAKKIAQNYRWKDS